MTAESVIYRSFAPHLTASSADKSFYSRYTVGTDDTVYGAHFGVSADMAYWRQDCDYKLPAETSHFYLS